MKIFNLLFIILALILVACKPAPITNQPKTSFDGVTAQPITATSINLISPFTNPGSNPTPTLQLTGVVPNTIVKVYTDANCLNEVGSGQALSSSINITTLPLLNGTYNFYSKSYNFVGISSNCSTIFLSYTYLNAPTSITYSSNPANYTCNTSIAANVPSIIGGFPTGYSISPSLPSGLAFNTFSGIISGIPDTVSPVTNYTITASNSVGSTSIILPLSVVLAPPANLIYSSQIISYQIGNPIIQNTPSNTGGHIASYSISPALPTGLIFDSSTGTITGTPTAITLAANYVVTGTNSSGSTTSTLTIAVLYQPPSNLNYGTNPATYIRNSVITNNNPNVLGGTPNSYSISPSLPMGLNFDTSTGVISGTPTAISPMTTYLVTASNNGGSTSVFLLLAVQIDAPSSLTYSANPVTYTKTLQIQNNIPTTTGGAPSSYTITPTLPSGLSFSTTTGIISGTPNVTSAGINYTITASNVTGSVSTTINISIQIPPPTNLTYSSSPANYIQGYAIAYNNPTTTGGVPTSYSISPALPNGLFFNTVTGVISGTPTTVTAAAVYTITASNSTGSTSFPLTITILVQAPKSMIYSANPVSYALSSPIPNNSPTVAGGAPTSFSVSPSLPSGLSLDPVTGIISGTPSVSVNATAYTITASNSSGSTTCILNLGIGPANTIPANLTYATTNATYNVSVAITNNIPTSTGGVITNFSVSPALPAGLSINPVNGVISGTPTTASAYNNYTVTGSNTVGSTTTVINIGVLMTPPTNLTYSSPNVTYILGETIATNSPSTTMGVASSYGISPPLPSGLILNTSNGIITGMPSVESPATTYTISASNPGGSTSTTIIIAVNISKAPLFKYQWHLHNTGQTNFASVGGTVGMDLNLLGTWGKGIKGQTGNGTAIMVLISDTGVEITHENLFPNHLFPIGTVGNGNVNKDFINGVAPDYLTPDAQPAFDTVMSNAHGTMVAGIIAASGNFDGKGVSGVAPNAKIASANMLRPGVTLTSTVMLDSITGPIDIVNQSWGSPQCNIFAPYYWYEAQMQTDRKVYVKSAGNDFDKDVFSCKRGVSGTYRPGNSNFDGNNTNPYTILVAALNASGIKSSYSSMGSNIWISGFGGEYGMAPGYTGQPPGPGIMTTDLSGCTYGEAPLNYNNEFNSFLQANPENPNCNYTSTMNGTSAAAPTISGAIALIKSAVNFKITTRDIRHILASTAVEIDPTSSNLSNPRVTSPTNHIWDPGWITNQAGYHFHNYYGFGKIDVDAAVNMATNNYVPLNPEVQTGYIASSAGLNLSIPQNSATGVTHSLFVAQSLTIEAIQIIPNITHVNIGNIGIELTSPAGTKSVLMNVNNALNGLANLQSAEVFLSNAFYGENSQGNWTIKIIDGNTASTAGTLNNWQINVVGHN